MTTSIQMSKRLLASRKGAKFFAVTAVTGAAYCNKAAYCDKKVTLYNVQVKQF